MFDPPDLGGPVRRQTTGTHGLKMSTLPTKISTLISSRQQSTKAVNKIPCTRKPVKCSEAGHGGGKITRRGDGPDDRHGGRRGGQWVWHFFCL